jgi:hypothetical protein
MSCEAVRELLPDFTLGTLNDLEAVSVRAHLRGCATCRSEASALDEGVALFASAAHQAEPPEELESRVMAVLAEEWAEAPTRTRVPRRWAALAAAAALVVVTVGSLAWAGVAQIHQSRVAAQAASYREFLHALGGKDVRVATLQSRGSSSMEGSAVLYDSDRGQSWVLVLVRSPGETGPVNVTLVGPTNQIRLRPIELAADGDGATWLVTSSDISKVRTVRITDRSGRLVASGTATASDE